MTKAYGIALISRWSMYTEIIRLHALFMQKRLLWVPLTTLTISLIFLGLIAVLTL